MNQTRTPRGTLYLLQIVFNNALKMPTSTKKRECDKQNCIEIMEKETLINKKQDS